MICGFGPNELDILAASARILDQSIPSADFFNESDSNPRRQMYMLQLTVSRSSGNLMKDSLSPHAD